MHKNFRQDHGPPNSIFSEYSGIFPWAQSSLGMNLFLVPRLRIREALSPIPPFAFMQWYQIRHRNFTCKFVAVSGNASGAHWRHARWLAYCSYQILLLNCHHTHKQRCSSEQWKYYNIFIICFFQPLPCYHWSVSRPEWILNSDSERLRMWLTSVLFSKAYTTDNKFGNDDLH
jgi:hypothetical protein